MKKTVLLFTLSICFLLLSSAATALLTSSQSFKGTLSENTDVFFIGKTSINGSFFGQPIQQLVNSSLVEGMGGFPLIGNCMIPNLHSVIVAENIDISRIDSLDDFLLQNYDQITSFSDVDIITDSGLFLLGIDHGTMNLSTELPYAITTVVPLEILPGTITRFFVVGTNHPLTLQCFGGFSILNTLSDAGTISVQNEDGTTLWTSGSPNDYILIQDTSFSLTNYPSLSLYPLHSASSTVPLTVSVSPAAADDIQIQPLIQHVTDVLGNFQEEMRSGFVQSIDELEEVLKASSFVANGAMVFLKSNDSVTIDRTTQHFSSTGFVRFSRLDITSFGSSTGPALQGETTLIFLGDHFYNPSAKQDDAGIRFPFELLIIWIISLIVFVYVRFFLRPPVDLALDAKMKRYALPVHLAVLVVTFLLLDLEVNNLFGISALSSLITPGASGITGVFFVLELIIWILGYLLLALPLQLLSNAVLRYLGIGKGGNGIWKAAGDFSIWVFCGFYLLLFFNILFSMINFNSLFAMG